MSNPGQDGNTRSAAFAGSAVPPTARTATPANVPARRIARESDIVRLLLRSDSPAVEGPRSRGATQTASLSLDRGPALIARPTVTVPLADAHAHRCCQCADLPSQRQVDHGLHGRRGVAGTRGGVVGRGRGTPVRK